MTVSHEEIGQRFHLELKRLVLDVATAGLITTSLLSRGLAAGDPEDDEDDDEEEKKKSEDDEDEDDDDEEDEEETWRVSGELRGDAALKDERGRMKDDPFACPGNRRWYWTRLRSHA